MLLKFEKRVAMGERKGLGFQAKRKTEIRTRNGGFGDRTQKVERSGRNFAGC
ncbi:uncharacterized protein SCHCODRAFT_02620400 [Schizophyllum commune H4-8]|uniref:uncharacterized protein n=1 Tax=Schizophyllum commune (strain H4-8 / FGSC 9210) TaxID=578458 RepID=UPI00215F583A|nr:uncharacterized protein SCHCODRAFT_02620400 [Schizophyllum commune H4-8]KAI5895823.1 hypothetical protein SCHCODRAFT_02620400 [Schizophyllum commune H4-8]